MTLGEAPNVESLIRLADELLADKNPDTAFSKLENYASAFDDWFKAYEISVQAGKPISSKTELESLLPRHEKVLSYSEEMRDSLPEEMKKLKAKGKGIMAYTDTLPKKISFTKTKKG